VNLLHHSGLSGSSQLNFLMPGQAGDYVFLDGENIGRGFAPSCSTHVVPRLRRRKHGAPVQGERMVQNPRLNLERGTAGRLTIQTVSRLPGVCDFFIFRCSLRPESSQEHPPTKHRRGPSTPRHRASISDRSAKRFAQDDGFVGGLKYSWLDMQKTRKDQKVTSRRDDKGGG
jgi:hypothetical protein